MKHVIKNQYRLLLTVTSLFLALSMLSLSCKKSTEPLHGPTVKAEFTADTTTIRKGETVSFTQISSGEVVSYKWTFEGGSPATSEQKDPKVTYSEEGVYKVTLEVSNSTSSDVMTKSDYITVTNEAQEEELMNDITKIIPKNNKYESWPVVVKTPSGAYLLSYVSNKTHKPVKSSDRKAIIQRSLDNGKTWTQVASLGGPSGEDWGTTIMGVAADGAIVLGVQQVKDKTHGSAANHIFFRSTDDGVTWTEVARYPWTNISNIQKVTLLNNGDLLATWHGKGWGMIRSTDNGMSWTEYSTTNGGQWLKEGHMVQLNDGTILDFGRAGNIVLGISTDNGNTFSRAVETGLGVKATGNNSTPTVSLLSDHQLLIVWIDREAGKMFATTADPYDLKTDPKAWNPIIEITDVLGGNGDKGYPYMIPEPLDKKIFTAWYEDKSLDHSPSIYTGWLSLEKLFEAQTAK